MISPQGLVLLDTNVLVHLVRGNPLGLWIDANFLEPLSGAPLISIVTVGETLALAKRWTWGPKKMQRFENLVKKLLVVDIRSEGVLSSYAEVDHALRRMGNPVQQNDMWIAATAIASEAHLLTADKDFDPLHPYYLRRTKIDPLSFG